MEHNIFNDQTDDNDELIIQFPQEIKKAKHNENQLVDRYVDNLFNKVSKLTSKSYSRIGFLAEVPVMKFVIKDLLLDYEKVLTDRFIGYLDESAMQIPDEE